MTVGDTSGAYAAGVVYGGTSYTPGVYGDAFAFDGAGDWIKVENFLWAGPFTLSMWVRADVLGQPDHTGVLSSSGYLWPNTFQVAIEGSVYQLESDAPNGDYALGPVATEWVHVVVAYDGNDLHTFYDGVPVESRLWEELAPPEFTALRIGANRLAGKLFTGAVDDVLLFDRALTDVEVQALYAGTATCIGL